MAALYIAANGRATNAAGVYAIRQALVDAGIDQDSANGLADDNDPDSNWENIGWSDGSQASCTTDSSGMCQISGFQWIWSGSISLSVVDVYHPDLTYDPAANEDPDGESDGTKITILRP